MAVPYDLTGIDLPVREDAPCGEDMSFSNEFDLIVKAREHDDPHLAQGEWATELRVADWPFVVAQCAGLLKNRTKDLRVAVWLSEGLANTEGYAGLARGCQALTGLCDRYWDQLYPLAEGGDQDLRIGSIRRFITYSQTLIRSIPITRGNSAAYSYGDYNDANQFETVALKDPELRKKRPEHKVTMAKFSASQKATPRTFYESLHADFEQARQAWEALAESIDRRLGADGPSFGPVRDGFEQASRVILRLIKEAGVLVIEQNSAEANDVPAGETGAPGGNIGGVVSNRTQALQQLEHVAEFFRRTEPHSPVAYLASKAVDWANMPLHEWLRQVVKDNGSLKHIQELLGVKGE